MDTPVKQAGTEPLPGYRLLEPLGRGGFGEVWKCEAPGGLHKAIKFVVAGGEECRREMSAFERMKTIRHPYLLTLERVELTGPELVMVMELADCQFLDRFRECQAAGEQGIPREELLGYLKEAAEALDTISTRHGLQHLDVKPQNLFLVAGHAKVGDYGLVRSMERVAETQGHRGFTPRYTAPEVLQGGLDARSDQYSLALVYVELLTGSFPYSGTTTPQLILQHVTAVPNLSALPVCDREVVARALSKDPLRRYPSCSAFVRALPLDATEPTHAAGAPAPRPLLRPPGSAGIRPQQHAGGSTDQTSQPDQTVLARRPARLPAPARPAGAEPTPPPPDPFAHLRPVMSVALLEGTPGANGPVPKAAISPYQYAEAVVEAASRLAAPPPDPATPGAEFTARFLCTMPGPMAVLNLVIVAERWGFAGQQIDDRRVVLWRDAVVNPTKLERDESRARAEVMFHLPAPPSSTITVAAGLYGVFDKPHMKTFAKNAREELPQILEEIRTQLQNQIERRAHPRYPATFPIRVFPLFPDGRIGAPIAGQCEDVGLGGLRFVTPTRVPTERLYVEVQQVAAVTDHALYTRLLRTTPAPNSRGLVSVCRFKTAPAPTT
jgi:serine/threonine protein kinase